MSRLVLQLEYLQEKKLGMLCETGLNYLPLTWEEKLVRNVNVID
jgi:hypothetical protein